MSNDLEPHPTLLSNNLFFSFKLFTSICTYTCLCCLFGSFPQNSIRTATMTVLFTAALLLYRTVCDWLRCSFSICWVSEWYHIWPSNQCLSHFLCNNLNATGRKMCHTSIYYHRRYFSKAWQISLLKFWFTLLDVIKYDKKYYDYSINCKKQYTPLQTWQWESLRDKLSYTYIHTLKKY